jgi:hypothetical protein
MLFVDRPLLEEKEEFLPRAKTKSKQLIVSPGYVCYPVLLFVQALDHLTCCSATVYRLLLIPVDIIQ